MIAGLALAAVAVFAPRLEPLGKLVSARQGAPAAEVGIDSETQLRAVCAVMAKRLPDLEKIDSTNDLVDFLEVGFAEAFTGTTQPPAINTIAEEISKALQFGETSKPITQAERVTAAEILAKHAEAPK